MNADDLGLSEGVNAGIVEAHEHGIVTSASLMVRRPAAGAAATAVGHHPSLAIGLHLELDDWVGGGESGIERECREQLDAFRLLLGRDPTHVDSHHHVHMGEPVASVVERLSEELGVPLRGWRIRYEGGFHGRSADGEPWPHGIGVDHLLALVESQPEGWTELGCHPGLGVDAGSSYGREREDEVRTLCDARVRVAIEDQGVELRSFAQFS